MTDAYHAFLEIKLEFDESVSASLDDRVLKRLEYMPRLFLSVNCDMWNELPLSAIHQLYLSAAKHDKKGVMEAILSREVLCYVIGIDCTNALKKVSRLADLMSDPKQPTWSNLAFRCNIEVGAMIEMCAMNSSKKCLNWMIALSTVDMLDNLHTTVVKVLSYPGAPLLENLETSDAIAAHLRLYKATESHFHVMVGEAITSQPHDKVAGVVGRLMRILDKVYDVDAVLESRSDTLFASAMRSIEHEALRDEVAKFLIERRSHWKRETIASNKRVRVPDDE
jgi:hypothetical protein